MDVQEQKRLVQSIVEQACLLKNKRTDQKNAPVNYACIFAQSKEEYEMFIKLAHKMGKIIQKTKMGPVFHIHPLDTVAGKVSLLKIRNPDPTRPERGDADFTVDDYPRFKKKYLSVKGFKLLLKENFEMLELTDPEFNVRVYFSHPPLDKQLGLR